MISKNDMAKLLDRRQPSFALEREFYTDPDIFRLDLEHIWYREWIFAGHLCELPKTGSYITLQIGEYPIMIVRDAKGTIRAMHNTCRHRGSKICKDAKGTSAKLVCPYHQWTYDLDGKLIFARQMGDNFDKTGYALAPVACEVVEGTIFICLAEHPSDFGRVRDQFAPYVLPHNLMDAKVAYENTIIEKGNWKLVWENNRECYHCAVNHPELCKSFPEAPTSLGVADGAIDDEVRELWSRCETAGLKAEFQIDPSGQFRATRVPLINGATSYTMDGLPAVSRAITDTRNVDNIGALLFYHYPSSFNHYLADYMVTFRITPISATETAVTTKWLVHKDAVEGVDYDKDRLTHVWIETNDQDRQIVEDNAAGVLSPAYRPGPYSEVHEGGVLQFVEWYASFIRPRLDGGSRAPILSVA
ncbi:MAG: aromatic ring-hydroxylating dioxygenase subunit alpha [Mesorhizobium sp.]|uniref:aromatic ring-hydroxylating oxygenase subunit alpha n=1 Tax=Mesorhizobium sp. TaxID=1871066 RepID=UPI000FE6B38B|nr:aromatic ring-hydroxylating dioxygenase subunit alpha [Mesorhizobium sp.]RWB32177.1 MAG: aromatic ring-hydroxylating dioxygenase subunit alpha [Mesorhizobium sp.]RWF79323.1 MAG: aromatic ring-hydroxylating dioxygenase subunit alpha [Mesorhizobium sp.]TIS68489.1 MAG: aromatic ring-hydroxylating dioxygenase subunit alpha [Mesorhizobium sp.]